MRAAALGAANKASSPGRGPEGIGPATRKCRLNPKGPPRLSRSARWPDPFHINGWRSATRPRANAGVSSVETTKVYRASAHTCQRRARIWTTLPFGSLSWRPEKFAWNGSLCSSNAMPAAVRRWATGLTSLISTLKPTAPRGTSSAT